MKLAISHIQKRLLSLEELKKLQVHGVCVIEAGQSIPEWAGIVIIDNIPEPSTILRTPGAGVIRP
jgi:hypothetical protein